MKWAYGHSSVWRQMRPSFVEAETLEGARRAIRQAHNCRSTRGMSVVSIDFHNEELVRLHGYRAERVAAAQAKLDAVLATEEAARGRHDLEVAEMRLSNATKELDRLASPELERTVEPAPVVGEHAVYARTADGERVRVSDELGWDGAQTLWAELDELRHAGRFPHVRHFEVRSIADPAYADAPRSSRHAQAVEAGRRGFKGYDTALVVAWKRTQGELTPHGTTQGTGGWFYWANGRTAAQGRSDLARHRVARELVVEGVDGRFYLVA